MSVLGKPEPATDVPICRLKVVALRGPTITAVVPGTTAEHPNRIVRLRFAVARIRLVGIQTPFQGY